MKPKYLGIKKICAGCGQSFFDKTTNHQKLYCADICKPYIGKKRKKYVKSK